MQLSLRFKLLKLSCDAIFFCSLVLGNLRRQVAYVCLMIVIKYDCACLMRVWFCGTVVGRINKVTLHRAGLVLRWVYAFGMQPIHTAHRCNKRLLRFYSGHVVYIF